MFYLTNQNETYYHKKVSHLAQDVTEHDTKFTKTLAQTNK